MTSPDKVAAYSDEQIALLRQSHTEDRWIASLDALRAERDVWSVKYATLAESHVRTLAERDAANRRGAEGDALLKGARDYVELQRAYISSVHVGSTDPEIMLLAKIDAHLAPSGQGAT